MIIECLSTKAGAIDSGASKFSQFLYCYAARVDLHRNLSRWLDIKTFVNSLKYSFDLNRRKHGRRTTSEVDRVDSRRLVVLSRRLNVSQQCLNVAFSQFLL